MDQCVEARRQTRTAAIDKELVDCVLVRVARGLHIRQQCLGLQRAIRRHHIEAAARDEDEEMVRISVTYWRVLLSELLYTKRDVTTQQSPALKT